MPTDSQELIEKVVDMYFRLGQNITGESTKFKNKLDPENGLDSSDLEALSDQIQVWISSLGLMSEKLHEVMTSKNDSV